MRDRKTDEAVDLGRRSLCAGRGAEQGEHPLLDSRGEDPTEHRSFQSRLRCTRLSRAGARAAIC